MTKVKKKSIHEFISLLTPSASTYISGQQLADKAGISRSAVWKRIKRLRRHGYKIESQHGLGYRMKGTTEFPVPWELKRDLRTSFIGKEILYKESADSTQRIALYIAENKPDPQGTVVIAEQQKKGRGRLKRQWLSPPGGLWLSVILKPEIPTGMITLLPLCAAVAVSHAIRDCTSLEAKLKWPNDVMLSGRKVAGILVDISAEAERVNYAVIGIGINANIDSHEISGRLQHHRAELKVTSLRTELGHDVNRLELTSHVLENLEKYFLQLENEGALPILKEWKKNTEMFGRQVEMMQNGKIVNRGTAIGLGEDGSLTIRTEHGKDKSIISGDILIRY